MLLLMKVWNNLIDIFQNAMAVAPLGLIEYEGMEKKLLMQ